MAAGISLFNISPAKHVDSQSYDKIERGFLPTCSGASRVSKYAVGDPKRYPISFNMDSDECQQPWREPRRGLNEDLRPLILLLFDY